MINFKCLKYNFDIIDNADKEDAKQVINEFTSRVKEPTINEAEVLLEQYNILKSRKLPAKDWLIRIIVEISKKGPEKRNIQYLIGMVRNRMNHGWGVLKSQEEQLITSKLEEVIGRKIPQNLYEKIYEMISSYGSTRMAFAIHKISLEDAIFKSLLNELNNQFDGRQGS